MKRNESVRRHRNAADSCSPKPQPDFTVLGSGSSVFLFQPETEKARAWLRQNFPQNENHQYFHDMLALGFRYLEDIVLLAVLDGLNPPAEMLGEGREK